jgi:hypothetical protein
MPIGSSNTFSSGQATPSELNNSTASGLMRQAVSPLFEYVSGIPADSAQSSAAGGTLSKADAPSQNETFSVAVRTPAVAIPQNPELVVPGRASKLTTRQLWLGTVTAVRKGGFSAILSDKTNPNNPDEQGTFDFDDTEISADDLPLVRTGSGFYWIIGTEESYARNVQNVSRLRFRHLPTWTKRQLDEATEAGRRLRQAFLQEEE